MASSSSSSRSINSWNYDVFLSFRGADTRNSFTGHLHRALLDKGINVFIDNELQRGEVITPQLDRVIEASRISIVVFSEKYASSSFCLDELVTIFECRKSKGQIAYPVFYKVDPTDVEEQIGTFGEELVKLEAQLKIPSIDKEFNYWNLVTAKASSFSRYLLGNVTEMSMRYVRPGSERVVEEQKSDNEEATENMNRVQKWRSALTEVARLSGWHLEEGNHEATTIQSIVKMVLKKLDRTLLHVAEHPVGLASRVDHILKELSLESNDVCMVGLQGMGGVGKTTIAKAIYNRCASEFEFDGSCFLLNVRVNSKKHGFAQLQETLLFEILGDQKHLMGNFEKGIKLIEERLGGKKVLIVIDDVDHIEQLQKLAGGLEWFGAGSRIIITTRDLRLLELHGVTIVHEIKELGVHEAMELFSWHAFKQPQPSEAYMELSHCVLRYAQGLPLALKVLGSSLYGRSVLQWEGVLKKLKRCPNNEIIDILKVSYDDLDSEEKEIFLDIACFFKGKKKDQVIKFLAACEFSADIGVHRLIEKSLVYIFHGVLEMHDLLETMGTQIALDESSCNPPGRRLCITEHVPRVFLDNKRANDIEGILLDFHGEEEVSFNLLENMTKLRLLIIRNGRVTRIPKSLPNSIRWLEWRECSLKTIPHGFIPAKLVVLEMPFSRIMHLDKAFAAKSKAKKFMDLTRMNFSNCEYLKETVDFSASPNLELLDFSDCKKLKKIDKSIGSLKKLEYMFLNGCRSVVNLPNLVEAQRLVSLSLYGCSKLENLPSLPAMLTELRLSETRIKDIPSFIGNLANLERVCATDCKDLVSISNSIFKLPRLLNLDLRNCSKLAKFLEAESLVNSSSLFPDLMRLDPNGRSLADLCDLDLSGNDFVTLPTCIFRFSRLRSLFLVNCKWLVDIPELPQSLSRLWANNCQSLERYSQFQNNFQGDFTNCHKLAENGMHNWTGVILENLSLISLEENPWCSYCITLPENEIPEWFSYTIEGNASSFKLPPPLINENFIGIACCAIFQVNADEYDTSVCWDFKNWFSFNNFYVTGFSRLVSPLLSEHMCLCFSNNFYLHASLQAEEISCEFFCYPENALVYKRFGVHFIYKN